MSLDFDTCLVVDDRLAVSDKLQYGVFKGAMENNIARFPANAVSSSSHTYNIQVPSRTTVMSKVIIWESEITLEVSATGGNGAGQINLAYNGLNKNLVAVGSQDSLGPWPLHSLMSTINCTINSNTVNMNCQDVLAQILRMNAKGSQLALNGTTPTAYDTYLNYTDCNGFITNPLGGQNNSTDEDINFRGSFPVTLWNPLDPLNPAPAPIIPFPPVAGTVYKQLIRFKVAEPLLISPLLFSEATNKAGIFGINNMSLSMQVGNIRKAWRHCPLFANPPAPASDRSWDLNVTNVSFANSALVFNFLTPPQSMPLPPRCAVPYYNLDRFILNNANTPQVPSFPDPLATVTLQSNAISLSSIPDKLILCVRKPIADQTCQDTDSFLTINSIDLTFNNKSGYCSGWPQHQLYRVSRENGSNQSFPEFSGVCNAGNAVGVLPVYTTGSLLILELNKDLCIPEEYLTSGSGGTFTLQFQINVTNYYSVPVRPELVLIAMNSGAFVLDQQSGSSYVKIGMLTPEIVSATKSKAPVSHSDMKRMVGSGFMDSLRSAWKMASPLVKKGVEIADQHSGSGLSASGLSASGMRAPKRRSLKDRLAH